MLTILRLILGFSALLFFLLTYALSTEIQDTSGLTNLVFLGIMIWISSFMAVFSAWLLTKTFEE